MEDNMVATAASFVWQLAVDAWEIYQLPIQWLYGAQSVPFIIYAGYILITLTPFAYMYLGDIPTPSFRYRREREIARAIDASCTIRQRMPTEYDQNHTEDYRLEYLRLLQDISFKQDAIQKELRALRLQQHEQKT